MIAKYIYIVADTNDGDNIFSLTELEENDLPFLKEFVNKLKKFKPYKTHVKGKLERTHYHNFPNSKWRRDDLGEKNVCELYNLSDEEFDLLMDYVPSGENGIHTIESIEILEVSNKEKLF